MYGTWEYPGSHSFFPVAERRLKRRGSFSAWNMSAKICDDTQFHSEMGLTERSNKEYAIQENVPRIGVGVMPKCYRIIRNTNVSSKNDALFERVAGVYRSLDMALDKVQPLQGSGQEGEDDQPGCPIWLYDEDADEQMILDDVRGDSRLGSIEEVK
jgi:hypothetical protein